MRFSQRKGFRPVSRAIQVDSMSDELRASLWNVLDLHVWREKDFIWTYKEQPGIAAFSGALWFHYFKKPLDERPAKAERVLAEIRSFFFAAEWFEVYDFMEWVLVYQEDARLIAAVNDVLQVELAGFRFISDRFSDITSEEEVELLENAIGDERFPGVQAHLSAALRLLSNRENPDYRNSIKESISAVESMAKVVTGQPQATLGEALAILEKGRRLHPALKAGFSKLYGYTSDEGGIRHAMLEEPKLTAADAKFFLLSSTSFINYLKALL